MKTEKQTQEEEPARHRSEEESSTGKARTSSNIEGTCSVSLKNSRGMGKLNKEEALYKVMLKGWQPPALTGL